MAPTYTTKQGDTWDTIALEVYGDEKYAGFLMESNYAQLDVLIFSAGAILNTPDIAEETEGDLPPWMDEEAGEYEDPEDDPYE